MRRGLYWALAMAMGCGMNVVQPPDPEKEEPSTGITAFEGEAISAATPPPAITGGTLFAGRVLHGGRAYAFVSNPDADAVEVLDVVGRRSIWTAQFDPGSEPARIAEDSQGRVHVALRKKGSIATLDVDQKTIAIHPVCPAPRGVTFANDTLLVACESGDLVTMKTDGSIVDTTHLERDIRDVLVGENGDLRVTRFRSAEMLTVHGSSMMGMTKPMGAPNRTEDADGNTISARYEPDVAWRTIASPNGGTYMLHQYATNRVIATKRKTPTSPAPYGGGGGRVNPSDPCGDAHLVVPAITRFIDGMPAGTVRLGMDPGAVDMAVSDGGKIAIAHTRGVSVLTPSFPSASQEPTCDNDNHPTVAPGSGQPIAVAFTASGDLLLQTRDPAAVWFGKDNGYGAFSLTPIVLATGSIRDTGFKIFHTPTQNGIACASCHPEGGEDGHTWNFVDLGARRTQALRGGVLATAPFHWGGDMHDISQLSHDVFTRRMGGDNLTEPQVNVLGSYINRLPTLPAPKLDAAAVDRGHDAFQRASCNSCHSGEHFTNNSSADVGTGQTLQVPSLIGVGARTPLMHDGCARTLMERFTNPKCGGTNHGNTQNLSPQELSDLVTYLESL